MQREKMLLKQFKDDFDNVSAGAKNKVSVFMATIISRCNKAMSAPPLKKTSLSNEPFIGIWADRDDMHDSSKWVREMRDNKWNQKA